MALRGNYFEKNGETYTAKASALNFVYAADEINVQAIEGKDRTFELAGITREGERVTGWNFTEIDGNIKIEITND